MLNHAKTGVLAGAVATGLLISGCGALPSGDDGERRIRVGTTSAPSTLDPASAWDGSWELFKNVYQTLLYFPTGSTRPEPDAAQSCAFEDRDSKVYSCTLRPGLTFSDGHRLDAEAVKYSIDRVRTINSPTGPAPLLANLAKVEAAGSRTVTFRLKKPDSTFPFVLATPAAALVDPAEYPADTPRGQRHTIVGSGPYLLKSYEPGRRAVLAANPAYKGEAKRKNDAVDIEYYTSSEKLMADLKAGELDLSFRGMTPRQVTELNDHGGVRDGVKLTQVVGAEINYLVFNPRHRSVANPAVRRAVANLVDRDALIHEVYQGTSEALYSMVPRGVASHSTPFYERYPRPDKDKAAALLAAAGVSVPVPLTFWYTTDRYGAATEAQFKELERQLESSELFDITVKGLPWTKFQEGYQKGHYPVFGRGWFPDFPDPDNYIAPFVGERNAVGTPYESARITEELLPRSRRKPDRGGTAEYFAEAQEIIADDVRLLPLWQGRLYVAAREDVGGVEWSLDPSTIMIMSELYKLDW
ncbi:ABC transporter substrate-binding protein [Streptomyces polyrhachis]|uniref:ABC transporter substrate-binding protein n=1 Tax=Streptomyces polyrhachis TaxID=1282885 RepID=A0ABW2G7V2_9ACTN